MSARKVAVDRTADTGRPVVNPTPHCSTGMATVAGYFRLFAIALHAFIACSRTEAASMHGRRRCPEEITHLRSGKLLSANRVRHFQFISPDAVSGVEDIYGRDVCFWQIPIFALRHARWMRQVVAHRRPCEEISQPDLPLPLSATKTDVDLGCWWVVGRPRFQTDTAPSAGGNIYRALPPLGFLDLCSKVAPATQANISLTIPIGGIFLVRNGA